MKKYGFTLTEILIALAIIGVVSALTLPGLMTSYQEKTFVTQLQTVYNLLTNAAAQLRTDEQVDSLAESSLASDGGPAAFLQNYFNITKMCSIATTEKTFVDPTCNVLTNPSCAEGTKKLVTSSDSTCFATKYRSLDKTKSAEPFLGLYPNCAVLSSGASVCIVKMDQASYISVDVNGPEPPNIGGRDFFNLYLLPNGKVIDGYGIDEFDMHKVATECKGAVMGEACFAKIVLDGWKMNY